MKIKTAETADFIVEELKKYCQNYALNGFAIGISGGIDSAVTSTLCAKTGKKVIAVNMPIYQDPGQESLSDIHIEELKKRYSNVLGIKIELTDAFKVIKKALPAEIQDNKLTMANTRSRIRMLTLYALASHNKLLVAGTGNKVEDFGVGFYTKYGDGGVDISPIADLIKSEVYELGRELGINQKIMQVAPTDGLWDDKRTDESQIGASYSELEWAMNFDPSNKEEITSRQKQVLEIYKQYHTANKHKMEPIPVIRIPEELTN